MSNRDINNLLEKYWNAETTLLEEVQLKEYFTSDSVTNEHKDFIPLFTQFVEEAKLSPSFEWKIPVNEKKEAKVFIISRTWKSIAAVFILALASIFLFKNGLTTTEPKAKIVNVEDPEEALEYTKMALAMVSKNYRKGSAQLSNSMGSVNKMNIIK